MNQTGYPRVRPEQLFTLVQLGHASVSEGAPFNSSYSEMYALFITQSPRAGDGGFSSTGTPVRPLLLDSGAIHHVVGDDRILANLRGPAVGMFVTVANGSQLAVTKVGDMQTPDIEITNVYLVPGLEMDLISVHQLAKSNIVTTFYENHAELWLEGRQIGRAIFDDAGLLYRLCFLDMPKHCSVSEGEPLNSGGYGDCKMYALGLAPSPRARDWGYSCAGTVVRPFYLDSGATHHMVSDNTAFLINLRNPPPGTLVTVADGSQLRVAKVGDIQTDYIKIKDVYLVPGLVMNLVSVRQLAQSKIFTTFYRNHAELWMEGTQIGGAIIDDAALLYELCFLQAP